MYILKVIKYGSRHYAVLAFLLMQLEDSPYSYNLHVELVKLLRSHGDLDQLRAGRESMSAAFPLTEGMLTRAMVIWYSSALLCTLFCRKQCLICEVGVAVLSVDTLKMVRDGE